MIPFLTSYICVVSYYKRSIFNNIFQVKSHKMADIRNQKLMSLAQMSINGQVTHKLDQIASVYINEQPYFNVFRRYNSPYNIVIEDYTGDIYLRKNNTVRKSLKSVLCLSRYASNNIYTIAAASFKHNGPVPYDADMIPDMRWTEIQGEYQAITVTFGGILDDNLQEHIPNLLSYYGQTQTNSSSSRKRPAEDSVDELYARRYTVDNVDDESIEDEEAETKKCRLIRRSNDTYTCECHEEQEEEESVEQDEQEEESEEQEEEEEEEEEPRMRNGKRSWCDNDDTEESEESEEQDDSKYVVLRNGHKIRKTSQ